MPVKSSGSLKLRDEICVEAGAINMETVGNGAPVNSQNHRINGNYTKLNYDSDLDSPRQMIDKAAGQQTRMSEYYTATRWKSARIVAGHVNEANSAVNDYKATGISAYKMNSDPEPFALQSDRPGFMYGTFGTADSGFSTTRGEIVDLTRLIGFVFYAFPAYGTPYVILYYNTQSQRLSDVLNVQSKEWGSHSGHLYVHKLTRADGAKAEATGSYNINSSATQFEEYANTQLADGTSVSRMQWMQQSLGPDTNGQSNLQPGDTFLIWFNGIR